MRYLLLFLAFCVGLAAPSAAEALEGTLKKIKDTGTIAIGYREESLPFSFLDENGQPAGYSVDLCKRIAIAVERELGLDELEVKFVPVDPTSRIPSLLDGTIDIECGSTTHTLSRQQKVDFTLMTFVTGARLLVKRASNIKGYEDLDRKRIAIAQDTSTVPVVEQFLKNNYIDAEIVAVKDHAAGFAALEAGEVIAYASDNVLLFGLAAQAPNPADYEVVGHYLSYEPYGFMVRRDDSAFRLVADRTLAETYRSEHVWRLYKKWFGPMGVTPGDLLKAMVILQALPE